MNSLIFMLCVGAVAVIVAKVIHDICGPRK